MALVRAVLAIRGGDLDFIQSFNEVFAYWFGRVQYELFRLDMARSFEGRSITGKLALKRGRWAA